MQAPSRNRNDDIGRFSGAPALSSAPAASMEDLFPASDESSHVNCRALVVDGGLFSTHPYNRQDYGRTAIQGPASLRIDEDLVRRLVATQFPQWAGLPIRAIEPGGWDNRTFRLGDDMGVRVPSAAAYAPQVEKERIWLPRLAKRLPVAIPSRVATGKQGEGLPWPWSIYRWLPGEPAAIARIPDLEQLAADLASFLSALHRVDASDGPAAGPENFHRGGSLAVYEAESRAAIERLGDRIDRRLATSLWQESSRSVWGGTPLWVHGDVSPGNLLVTEGRLSAVIDFGMLGVGDPACDLTIAWTFFRGASRSAFRDRLQLDRDTWARARGWALWKALVTVAGMSGAEPAARLAAGAVLDDLLQAADES
jgi:aminoglycoside phosphotransferase (APT) family kinase protein